MPELKETRTVFADGKVIEYELVRKSVKNINLRITSDTKVHVSANRRVSLERIENFIKSKSDFIFNAIERFSKETINKTKPLTYMTGERLFVFGEEYEVVVNKSNRNYVTLNDSEFILNVKDVDDTSLRVRTAEKYLNAQCEAVINALCERVHKSFIQDGVKFPIIKFRRMTSRWGSCHMKKGVLTFNYALVTKPIKVIEYVVYHEFTHFLVPNHSNAFYAVLSLKFPDWKECRKILKK